MLRWRLAMSALLIPAFVGLFWADHRAGAAAPLLFVVCLLLGLRCAWEMALLLRPRFPEVQFLPCAVCVGGLAAAAWLPHGMNSAPEGLAALGPAGLTYAICILGLLGYEASRYEQPGQRMIVDIDLPYAQSGGPERNGKTGGRQPAPAPRPDPGSPLIDRQHAFQGGEPLRRVRLKHGLQALAQGRWKR